MAEIKVCNARYIHNSLNLSSQILPSLLKYFPKLEKKIVDKTVVQLGLDLMDFIHIHHYRSNLSILIL